MDLVTLRRPLHGDDGEIPPPREIADLEGEPDSWPATNEYVWRGAGLG
jgi:hypothetical protein